jgi:hypothetical protein
MGEDPESQPSGPVPLRRGEQVVVGLLAEPDLPVLIARHLVDVLPGELAARVSRDVDWRVEIVDDPFAATAHDEPVIDKARLRSEGRPWEIALCLTDMPLEKPNGAVVAMISAADRVALISLPALGGIRLRRSTRDVAAAIVDELTVPPDDEGKQDPRPFRLIRRETPPDGDVDLEMVMPVRGGRIRMLAGIVRANRPWQLSLGLSTALAGAMAGSAFGILYSAIWVLATVLEPWRLAAITVAANGVLAIWLLAGHGLWERRPYPRPVGWLINAATVLTVVNGVAVFFLALFAFNLAAAALVIPAHHMATVLGHPVGAIDYLRISLMSSVLGTIAGAVGSGLEDDETVRRAAYGTRRQIRRRIAQTDQ